MRIIDENGQFLENNYRQLKYNYKPAWCFIYMLYIYIYIYNSINYHIYITGAVVA